MMLIISCMRWSIGQFVVLLLGFGALFVDRLLDRGILDIGDELVFSASQSSFSSPGRFASACAFVMTACMSVGLGVLGVPVAPFFPP